MEHNMKQYQRDVIVRTGTPIAIVAPAKAVKRSLLNAFAKQPAPILCTAAGTTRDMFDVKNGPIWGACDFTRNGRIAIRDQWQYRSRTKAKSANCSLGCRNRTLRLIYVIGKII